MIARVCNKSEFSKRSIVLPELFWLYNCLFDRLRFWIWTNIREFWWFDKRSLNRSSNSFDLHSRFCNFCILFQGRNDLSFIKSILNRLRWDNLWLPSWRWRCLSFCFICQTSSLNLFFLPFWFSWFNRLLKFLWRNWWVFESVRTWRLFDEIWIIFKPSSLFLLSLVPLFNFINYLLQKLFVFCCCIALNFVFFIVLLLDCWNEH